MKKLIEKFKDWQSMWGWLVYPTAIMLLLFTLISVKLMRNSDKIMYKIGKESKEIKIKFEKGYNSDTLEIETN